MKTLYLDLLSGISGDMFLGALLDLGVDFASLEKLLAGLGVGGYRLKAGPGTKQAIRGTQFTVVLEEPRHEHGRKGRPHRHEHHGRSFADIRKLIETSELSPWIQERSVAVFARVARAEGKIHGCAPEAVHFHEVGAVDSIVDIVGASVALELLGRPRVLASAVVDGSGWIECAHGRFPVPAPATLAILGERGVPVSQCEEPCELVTPTGAALLAEWVEHFGPMKSLVASRVGYGLGQRDLPSRPNVLRAVLGESGKSAHDWETDAVAVLETNLDDINPEVLGAFVEHVLQAGALDVFYLPAQMKKNRPGALLTVLCAEQDADRFTEMILVETSAFGVRRTVAERRKLRRTFRTVATPYGEVSVKVGTLDGRVVQQAPEFSSCRKLAAASGQPVKAIYEAAIQGLNKP